MINDYTSLRNAVSRWLHRSDLASAVGDFIALAEMRFNRNLRVRQMEKRLVATSVDGAIVLPEDWLEFVGSPMAGEDQYRFSTRDAWPGYSDGVAGHFYTIIGSELLISGNPATAINAAYYARIPSLSEGNPTNWLLNDGPDIYLYGSLLGAEPYLKNDARIETWRGLLQVALTDLQAASDRAKYSGGTLVIEAP